MGWDLGMLIIQEFGVCYQLKQNSLDMLAFLDNPPVDSALRGNSKM